MTEGLSTGFHVRDAVIPVSADGDAWPSLLPLPHPVRKGNIVRRRLATTAVRHSGLQLVPVTLVRAFMCCFREWDLIVLI
jgi:hypothetical protein